MSLLCTGSQWVCYILCHSWFDVANPIFFEALDPRYKLQYFADRDWPADWINTVKEITRNVYNEDYPSIDIADLPISPKKPPPPSGDWPSLLRRKQVKATVHDACDELTSFWTSHCEPTVTDPLQHWRVSWLGSLKVAWHGWPLIILARPPHQWKLSVHSVAVRSQ